MPLTSTLLKAIRKTEPRSFKSFLNRLVVDRPAEPAEYVELRNSLDALEAMELITFTVDRDNSVVTLALTDLGLERLTEIEKEEARPRPPKIRTAVRRYV